MNLAIKLMCLKKYINSKRPTSLAKKGSKKWFKMIKLIFSKKCFNSSSAMLQLRKSSKNFLKRRKWKMTVFRNPSSFQKSMTKVYPFMMIL